MLKLLRLPLLVASILLFTRRKKPHAVSRQPARLRRVSLTPVVGFLPATSSTDAFAKLVPYVLTTETPEAEEQVTDEGSTILRGTIKLTTNMYGDTRRVLVEEVGAKISAPLKNDPEHCFVQLPKGMYIARLANRCHAYICSADRNAHAKVLFDNEDIKQATFMQVESLKPKPR